MDVSVRVLFLFTDAVVRVGAPGLCESVGCRDFVAREDGIPSRLVFRRNGGPGRELSGLCVSSAISPQGVVRRGSYEFHASCDRW